jgi:hypothetical protein
MATPLTRSALLKLSTALTTLMFMPLLNALVSGPAWLHWSAVDSVAAGLAHTITFVFIGSSLWMAARRGDHLPNRRLDILCALWMLLALTLALGGIAKVGALGAWLTQWRRSAPGIIGGAGLVILAATMAAIRWPGPATPTRVQRTIIFFWPLSLLFAFHLVNAPWSNHWPDPNPRLAAPRAPAQADALTVPVPRTVILLFDEWSPDLVYGSGAPDLSPWPAIAQLVSTSSVYLDAHLDGGETALAIPNLLGHGHAAGDNLIAALTQQHRSVRVWGWYHDYCRDMALAAQACQSVSIYNTRTLSSASISPLNPWWTNLNLLPAEWPFRMLKEPAAVAFHRATLDAMSIWLDRQLEDRDADVIYVHVNVPHAPLVSHHLAPGVRPFQLTPTSYFTQYEAINTVLDQVMRHAERPTRLVALSDHNARPLTPHSEHDHVVLMVREPHTPQGVRLPQRSSVPTVLRAQLTAPASSTPNGVSR